MADRLMHGPDHPSRGGFIAQGICRQSSVVSISRVVLAIESYLALRFTFHEVAHIWILTKIGQKGLAILTCHRMT